jgi:two-component system LytT family response regulator
MANIRVVIADDEKFARERLLQLLQKQPDVEIVAIATSGIEALRQTVEKKPDVLFLDIQMPDLDGFGVLRELEPPERPLTIFVTAFDQYAIQAFDAQGVDYLMKPFSDERFEAALDRARSYLRTRTAGELGLRLARLLDRAEEHTSEYLDRFVIKSGGRVTFLRVAEIDWVEAAGVYVYLHAGKQSELYRATLGQMEKKLNPRDFARVNRSAIVRLDRIQELRAHPPGRDYSIVLKNGTVETVHCVFGLLNGAQGPRSTP